MRNTFTPGTTPNTVRAADGKILTVPKGWVLPQMVGWVNDSGDYVEWVYALGERVDWLINRLLELEWVNASNVLVNWDNQVPELARWGQWAADGRFCTSTTALPQQFIDIRALFPRPPEPARPSWQTTEGTGQVNREVKPYRKAPMASQSRGGRRFA